jgi:hypothetical protein
MSRNGRFALLAFGPFVVLLDAGAKYSGEIWRSAPIASEHAAVAREDSGSRMSAYPFRLSATLPLDGMRVRCAGEASPTDASSPSSDDALDIDCSPDSATKAARDSSRARLLSWPGDSRHDRAVRF